MRKFKVRTQHANSGDVSNPRNCQWLLANIDDGEVKIEIDGSNGDAVRITLITEHDILSINLESLISLLRVKDVIFADIYPDFKRIKL